MHPEQGPLAPGDVVDERVARGEAPAHRRVQVVVAHHQVAHGAVRDGVHHEALVPGPRAGPDVPGDVPAVRGHVDGRPGAAPAAERPEVDHALVAHALGRRRRHVAADRPDVPAGDRPGVEQVRVGAVEGGRGDLAEGRVQHRDRGPCRRREAAAEQERGLRAATGGGQAGQHHAAAARAPDAGDGVPRPQDRGDPGVTAAPRLGGPGRARQAGAAAIMTSAAAVPPDRTGIARAIFMYAPYDFAGRRNEPLLGQRSGAISGQ